MIRSMKNMGREIANTANILINGPDVLSLNAQQSLIRIKSISLSIRNIKTCVIINNLHD